MRDSAGCRSSDEADERLRARAPSSSSIAPVSANNSSATRKSNRFAVRYEYLDQDCGEGLFDDDPEASCLRAQKMIAGTRPRRHAQVNDFNLDPDPADERDIVANGRSRLWPQLDPSRIMARTSGLRPPSAGGSP